MRGSTSTLLASTRKVEIDSVIFVYVNDVRSVGEYAIEYLFIQVPFVPPRERGGGLVYFSKARDLIVSMSFSITIVNISHYHEYCTNVS